MSVIDNVLEKVKTFEKQLSSGILIKDIILENEAYIVDMNTEEQLYEKGVNRLGVSIADYAPYSPVTIQIKQIKGQPYNRVTLRDEGDFHSSFYIVADNQKFEIRANDPKTEGLITKYGRQILGLTNENIAEVIHEYILPDLINKAKEQIL